jgi:SAM-dependent methyltransferase
MECTLCSGRGDKFMEIREKRYYRCSNCKSIFMHNKDFLSKEDEEARYREHNNDVEDFRYQEFVSDITNEIKKDWKNTARGLDFGAGTGPVITKLLNDKGYDVEIYDPFFWNENKLLNKTYDFIVLCEVIEHFHNPLHEFELLYSLLNERGKLYCKTDIYKDEIDFKSWYYKDDPTHVFFYHEETFKWMVENIGFNNYEIKDRVIILEK